MSASRLFSGCLMQETTGIPPNAADLSIFAGRLRNIAWRVGTNVMRSVRSTLMQQGDLAAGVLDASGAVIALDEHLPLMAFSLAPGVRSLVKFFSDDINPGDVFIQNDVWHGNIQHADTGLFVPVFDGEILVAWVACRGHWSDIGGAVAGTANPAAKEVWQEALRIPPLRLIARGKRLADVWEMVFANIRMREHTEGDARAMIGACQLGADAVAQIVSRCGGVSVFNNLTGQMFEASRRAALVAIGQLPSGEFRGRSVFIDDAPQGIAEYPVQVCVTVGGPTVIIDFTGSAPQNDSMMNSPLAATAAAALTTALMLLGPDVAHDEGVLRIFEVRASSGSMLNAEFPAATYGGNKMCEFIGSAIMAAFAQALPDRICAEWSRRLSLRAAGRDPRTGKNFLEIFFLTYAGGGAVQGVDGYDQPGLMSGGNVLHQDYEFMELRTPLTLWKHEYVPDSAGRGQWRGGLGNETVMELRGQQLTFVCHGGGTTEAAQGILGGEAGCLNLLEITDATGQVRQAHAREKIGPLVPPVMLRQISGGGGGYGPVSQRDPAAEARDIADGVVSHPPTQEPANLEYAA